LKPLERATCPFANLPEPRGGRWGQGLTTARMQDCPWLKPELVAQFEFVEWRPDNHLLHSRLIAFRDDRDAKTLAEKADAISNVQPVRYKIS